MYRTTNLDQTIIPTVFRNGYCNIRSILAGAYKCLAHAGYIQLPVVYCNNYTWWRKVHSLTKNVILKKNITHTNDLWRVIRSQCSDGLIEVYVQGTISHRLVWSNVHIYLVPCSSNKKYKLKFAPTFRPLVLSSCASDNYVSGHDVCSVLWCVF